MSDKESIFKKPHIWAFTTYFAEGFPFTIIRSISSLFFRDMKVSLESIGLTSLFGLPWIIKFLWGPQIDEFGTKRKWMLIMQSIIAAIILVTAFLAPLSNGVQIIAVLFFFAAFIAATHDITIDGYYMEALDKNGQAKFLGYRVMAYRIAMMTGTGVVATIGATISWFAGFLSAGILMGFLFIYHLFFLPKCETEKKPISDLWKTFLKLKFIIGAAIAAVIIIYLRNFFNSSAYTKLKSSSVILKQLNFANAVVLLLLLGLIAIALLKNKIKGLVFRDQNSFYLKAFISFMEQEKIGVLLGFIILIRAGEFMLSAMVSPFIVDLGIKAHYGWISGGIGLPASIIGAMVGGWLISKYSMQKMIWPFLLAQNFTNIIYMILALSLSNYIALNTGAAVPTFIGTANLIFVALVHGFDQFSGGLGTAVLTTYLMRMCRVEYKAAHYAIGSGLMSVSGLLTGIASGFITAKIGYGYFFGLSFVASIPGMILLFFVPKK